MANRPTEPPDPKPAKLLRAQLAYARAQGFTFDQAWEFAMSAAAGVTDKWWRTAFEWSRDEWKACYERRPQTAKGNVLEQLSLPSVGDGVEVRGPDDLTPAA